MPRPRSSQPPAFAALTTATLAASLAACSPNSRNLAGDGDAGTFGTADNGGGEGATAAEGGEGNADADGGERFDVGVPVDITNTPTCGVVRGTPEDPDGSIDGYGSCSDKAPPDSFEPDIQWTFSENDF